MTNITLQNNVLNPNYNKILDKTFKTFVKQQNTNNLDIISIDKLFEYYDNLFYQIPKEGSINSHMYILNKTLEYLNLKLADDESIQILLNEITNLRKQIIEDNTILNETN